MGQFGIWRRHQEGMGPLGEIEALGYGTLWLGGSPSLDGGARVPRGDHHADGRDRHPQRLAPRARRRRRGARRAARDFGERFLLGIGIGHPEATSEYKKPLTKMREFLDGLDAADPPVPPDERVVAALGPKMLDLAAERSLGAHPYFTTAEHTRFARERVGPDALVATEVAVVVDPDRESAREKARDYAAGYLRLTNYASSLLRSGFTEAELADGGSDRLIDAVIPHGSAEAIAEAVHAHLDAGADHVCLQPVGHGNEPLDDYRALAAALL